MLFFLKPTNVCRRQPLHDFRKGADRFRHRETVYEVLCARALYGGEVLPPKWCLIRSRCRASFLLQEEMGDLVNQLTVLINDDQELADFTVDGILSNALRRMKDYKFSIDYDETETCTWYRRTTVTSGKSKFPMINMKNSIGL